MSLVGTNLSCYVGDKPLLNDVCIELDVGRIMVLIGANGAGKSTLLNLLAGCPSPTTGTVLLDDKPLLQWSWTEVARRRAMLTQSITMAFDFTVADVVRLGSLPYETEMNVAVIDAAIEQALWRMDISQLRERRCTNLSGGERQRVQLARVLVQTLLAVSTGNPAYMLLDEPLAGLDLAHQFHFIKILRDLMEDKAAYGIGVAAVMHDLDMAFHCADFVVLLKEGEVFCQGTAREVITAEHIYAALGVNIAIVTSATGHDHVIVESALSSAGR